MNNSDSTPSYIVGHVPTGIQKRNWKDYFKVTEDYEKWVLSGMYHVYFSEDDEEIRTWYLGLVKKQEYVRNTREDNYKASCKLEGFEGYKEEE